MTPGARRRGRLFVVSGPSGVGKSTVVGAVASRHERVWLSVSTTTRAPRPGDVEGRDYFFVTREQFDNMRAVGDFVESAQFAGNWYGTPRDAVEDHLRAGDDAILEIDLAGARQVKTAFPGAVTVFIEPPSWDALRARLTGRGTDSEDAVAARLDTARAELAAAKEFDHRIVNSDLEATIGQLVRLIDSPARP